MSDVRCLTCGAPIVDALAGSCHACGAEDRHIGTQWLLMPAEQLPLDAAPRAATQPLGKLLSTVDLAIDAFDPMAPDWPNFEKSVVALRALKQARALLSVGDKAEAPE